MSTAFPDPSTNFFGRDEYVTRFKARRDYFRFFLYEGIAGAGKTALILKLAQEAKSPTTTAAVYLSVFPGERISSIQARLSARISGRGGLTFERQGDPYARLTDLLESTKTLLILDDLENLRRDDLTTMVRVFKTRQGSYRVIGAIRGDPELAAMDRVAIHLDRVGALSPADVRAAAAAHKWTDEMIEPLVADATRGGCTAHPLTLRYILALCSEGLPGEAVFERQSARSVTAFKALMGSLSARLSEADRHTLGALSRVGLPLSRAVASKTFGPSVDQLIQRGLLDCIDDDVYPHLLVGQCFREGVTLSADAAKASAKYLEARAQKLNEPICMIGAADVLGRAGFAEQAVDTLSSGWEAVRDLGFLEAYLKTLASLPVDDSLAQRRKLLAARARMRQGLQGVAVAAELESLAQDQDPWTQARALAALTHMYTQGTEYEKVVAAFEKLRELSPPTEVLLPAGSAAAEAMARLGEVVGAEKLARSLLGVLKGHSEPEREGELGLLLGRVHGQAGKLSEAGKEVQRAAALFEKVGDLYQAATAHSVIGDLYREAGEFELAREAFQRYLELARKWGDRDLIQIAELAEAWVALDVGDITHAASCVEEVEKEMSPRPSSRLRAYLASAKALLQAGRGSHAEAAVSLERVADTWQKLGQQPRGDLLRAHAVRAHIASGSVQRAKEIVTETLARLDENVAAPRVATFLRESALIRLRNKDTARAMDELAQARKLFAKGGNRREEALTLHRIAHAAYDEGDIDLAETRADEALRLAREIKHARAEALALEVQGRIALIRDDAHVAVDKGKEALQALRKLGDEIGTLHISEWLLRAQLIAGDVAGVLRVGPKVCEHAQAMQIREVRVRAIALTGVALLRRSRVDAAARCFRELSEKSFSPWSRALMWRVGMALASVTGAKRDLAQRQTRLAQTLRGLPEAQRVSLVHAIEQLDLPPRERCVVRTVEGETVVGTEKLALLDPAAYELVVDVQQRRVFDGGTAVELPTGELASLFYRIVLAAPGALSYAAAGRLLAPKAAERAKAQAQTAPSAKASTKALARATIKTPAKSGTKSATKSGTKSATKSGTKSATKSGTKSATKSGTKSATKSGTKSAAKSDTKSAAKSDTKSAAKSDTKSAAKSGTKSAAKSDTKSAAKSDTKSAAKSGTKSAAESGSKAPTKATSKDTAKPPKGAAKPPKGPAQDDKAIEKAVKEALKKLQTELKVAKHVSLTAGNDGLQIKLPRSYAIVVPTWSVGHKLSAAQKQIIKILRRYGSVPLQALQEQMDTSRAAVRRELGGLMDAGLVEPVRAGRGQAYRLA